MHHRKAVLLTALAVLVSLPVSAAGNGPVVGARRHHDQFHTSPFRRTAPGPVFFPPVVVVQVPVAVPVPVAVVPPPPIVETAPPPPPSPPEEMPRRPTVANPGPKLIEISPPARGAKTVKVTVQRGSSTVVETVPVQ